MSWLRMPRTSTLERVREITTLRVLKFAWGIGDLHTVFGDVVTFTRQEEP